MTGTQNFQSARYDRPARAYRFWSRRLSTANLAALVLISLGLLACGRVGYEPLQATDEPVDGSPGDDSQRPGDGAVDPGDGAVDPPVGCWTWSPTHIDPCELTLPLGGLVLTGGLYYYNTDDGTLLDFKGGPVAHSSQVAAGYRVVSVDNLEIAPGSTLRATGSLPLVIASFGSITIDGALDVSSGRVAGRGAGANPAHCNLGDLQPGEDSADGAGGGGGGGYQGDGGRGGNGDSNGAMSQGGAGCGASPVPESIAGGCRGADGGMGFGGTPGFGGHGGGAVELVAQIGIDISGVVHAGGAGGSGGSELGDNGGGGGGSGGYIGLDSRQVNLQGAILAANGGGGGEGSATAAGVAGSDGTASGEPAAGGGGGTTTGSDGGDGGASLQLNGAEPATVQAGGGGGGGGGVGYIMVYTDDVTQNGATVSPAEMYFP